MDGRDRLNPLLWLLAFREGWTAARDGTTYRLSVPGMLGFAVSLLVYIVLLPLLNAFINQGAQNAGPMVALILYSVPIFLAIGIVISAFAEPDRPGI